MQFSYSLFFGKDAVFKKKINQFYPSHFRSRSDCKIHRKKMFHGSLNSANYDLAEGFYCSKSTERAEKVDFILCIEEKLIHTILVSILVNTYLRQYKRTLSHCACLF